MGKVKHNISNWKQYNQALVNRGSVTFWRYVAVIKVWHCLKHHGHRGREFIFSNTAIETALMVKGIFRLPLRGLEGFLNAVLTLMTFPLKSPTYTCISKRIEDHKS
ncbi:Mobile element protein [Candidatus Enterovibrio escicola]|uniref:Mobile element protein n=1 Tax=Candidatus Enterovibrio escicola TaxID=1927127 RepID=A0A2A5T2Z2_9GAMM|nr:Mobile element protein [Candidatus Enterovibrio escacola]